jgi:hypothetical protein
MPTTALDHLFTQVAWTCTKCAQPMSVGCHCWDRITPAEKKQAADAVRLHVREYVRGMYPEVWRMLTVSQRTSIFNCVSNAVSAALGDLNPRVQDWPGDRDC